MDTGEGRFAGLSDRKFEELKLKRANGLFKTGEVVEIHGSSFEVKDICDDGKLVLQLLSNSELLHSNIMKEDIVPLFEDEEHRKSSMQQARNIFNKGKIH